MHGARVLAVRGDFDQALAAARELAARGTHALVNSINPYRREGQKTAVYEIVEELGGAAGRLRDPLRRRRQHVVVRAGARRARASRRRSSRSRRPTAGDTVASAIRIGDPAHADAVRRRGRARAERRRRGDPGRLAGAGDARRAVLRAVQRRRPGRDTPRRRPRRAPRRHDHRARPQGRRERRAPRTRAGARSTPTPTRSRGRPRDRPRAGDIGEPRARASTASASRSTCGTSSRSRDGAGVEVEGVGADELAADETNLGVRAYARLADPAGKRFRFVNRIPLERGLGSSAAAIALGLVAAAPDGRARRAARDRARARAARRQPRRRARRRRDARRATGASRGSRARCRSTPVAVVPESRVRTQLSRDTPARDGATRRCRAHRRSRGAARRGRRERRSRAFRRARSSTGCTSPTGRRPSSTPSARTCRPGGARRHPVRLGADRDRLGRRARPRAPPSLRERFPEHEVLELQRRHARGARVTDAASSTAARGTTTWPGTSPAPSISTRRTT